MSLSSTGEPVVSVVAPSKWTASMALVTAVAALPSCSIDWLPSRRVSISARVALASV